MIKEVEGYEGLYGVDELGTVYSIRASGRYKTLKPQTSTGGYQKVMLYKDQEGKWKYVHRLVAAAFISNPDRLQVVNHLDANPRNNQVSNLEWTSQTKNIQYSRKLGNQAKDKSVSILFPSGEWVTFGNMRAASQLLFGGPYVLRSQYRRKGKQFVYHGYKIQVKTGGDAT